jgi:beta-lactamase class A
LRDERLPVILKETMTERKPLRKWGLGLSYAVLIGVSLLVASSYALSWHLPDPLSPTRAPSAPASGGDIAQEGSADVSSEIAPVQANIAPAPAFGGITPRAVGPSDEQWDAMTHDLSKLASRYPGHVAIDVEDLGTGKTWTYHADDLFPAASLIKVPVMASVFAAIRQGRMSLDDVLVLRREDRVGGSGVMKWLPTGTRMPVRGLLQHMIRESDNVALTMLLNAVGFDFARRQFPDFGLVYTGLNREGLSLRSGWVPHENYTTAREMTMLMKKIYQGWLVDPESSRQMLGLLERKKEVASRLEKGLPRGWKIAHKTGLERQACHDSAILFSPEGRYVLTVLTGHNPNYKMAKNFIVKVGHVTFRYYGGHPDNYYAKAYTKGRRRRVIRG